jgi:hypothetical protein
MKGFKEIGHIFVGDTIYVSDPCYEVDIWCALSFNFVKSGEYKCYIKEVEYGSWGRRIEEMMIVHIDHIYDKNIKFDYNGRVAVDSGTMSISDYDYYDTTHTGDTEKDDEWYNIEVCEKTCGDDNINHNIAGTQCFIATSGIGDGMYDVESAEVDGETYAVKVIFLD